MLRYIQQLAGLLFPIHLPMLTMIKDSQRELHDYISEISASADVQAGSPLPFGTQERRGGVNFAIFSRHASHVRLELFNHPDDSVPARSIDLDSTRHRTDCRLPPLPVGCRWYVAVDTAHEAPQDLFAAGEELLWEDPQTYHLSPRSSVILLARCTTEDK